MKKKVLAFVLSFAMAFTLIGGVAFADENDNAGAGKTADLKARPAAQGKISTMVYNSDSDYLNMTSPASNAVYYKGEKITYTFYASDTWDAWWSEPDVFLMNNSTHKYYKSVALENVPIDEWDVLYKYSFTLPSTLPTGKYTASVQLFPVDDDDNLPADYDEVDYQDPLSYATITVKKLYAPTNVKATAGKRKATLSWTKATGAQKYYIYRSTKKTSGFKYIGKTTTAKYVDKNLKKGKRYYYKVKSVRTSRSLLKSSYSYRASALIK